MEILVIKKRSVVTPEAATEVCPIFSSNAFHFCLSKRCGGPVMQQRQAENPPIAEEGKSVKRVEKSSQSFLACP
jgi:hypothetical protein